MLADFSQTRSAICQWMIKGAKQIRLLNDSV